MTNKHQNKTKTAGRFSRSHSAVSIPSVPNDPNRCSFSGRVKHADCAQTSLINERVPAKLNSGFSSESVQLEGKKGRLSDLTLNLSCQVAIYCSALTVNISGFRMTDMCLRFSAAQPYITFHCCDCLLGYPVVSCVQMHAGLHLFITQLRNENQTETFQINLRTHNCLEMPCQDFWSLIGENPEN